MNRYDFTSKENPSIRLLFDDPESTSKAVSEYLESLDPQERNAILDQMISITFGSLKGINSDTRDYMKDMMMGKFGPLRKYTDAITKKDRLVMMDNQPAARMIEYDRLEALARGQREEN